MQYKVHSRHDTMVDVPAKTPEGLAITGRMSASIVELVPANKVGSTITLTVATPGDADKKAAADLYKVGSTVEVSVARAKGA